MSETPAADASLETVTACLAQSIAQLKWMEPLRVHIESHVSDNWVAIGFDTNALKKLRRLSANDRAAVLTFLQSKSVMTILPAQAVQEFWNNHSAFTRDVERIESDTRKLADRFGRLQAGDASKQRLTAMATELSDLADDVADSQNPHLLKDSADLWEILLPEALVAHVPRGDLTAIGEARRRSGIAPGFADDKKRANDLGDFFVWADFLYGLVELNLPLATAHDSTVVFVTDDAKDDWLTSGVPHPTLLGEVHQLTGRTLEIFGMDHLVKLAKE